MNKTLYRTKTEQTKARVIMKKIRMRFLSLFLCLLLTVGTVGQYPITLSATEAQQTAISDNTTDTPSVPDSDNTETDNTDDDGTESGDTPAGDVTPGTPDDSATENGDDSSAGSEDSSQDTSDSEETSSSETDDDTKTPDIDSVSSEAEATNFTAYFYDADGTTLLFTVPMQYDGIGYGVCLCDFMSSSNLLSQVRNGYQIVRWKHSRANNKGNLVSTLYDEVYFYEDTNLYAFYDTEPYEYSINYQLNGGALVAKNGAEIPYTFTVKSGAIQLPAPQRKGFIFNGWYTDPAFTKAVTAIPAGTFFNSDANGNVPSYTVYAKWTSVTPGATTLSSAKNSGTGKIKLKYSKATNAQGYEITYATNKKFTKNKNSIDAGTKTTYTFTNLPKGKKYYYKVRAYVIDSTGEKCYGSYSKVLSCKVKKGVREYEAKKNSGKLKKVSILGAETLYVKAKVSKRLKSSDNFYYLVKVDPYNGKVLKKIAKAEKTKTVEFKLPVTDNDGNNHIQGKFAIAVKKGKKYKLISSSAFISNPEAAAHYTAAFPTPVSKKGRQGCYDTSMGDKNYFYNFNLNSIIATKGNHQVAYKYNGKTYYFNNPNFGHVSEVNKDGGTVTVQVMLQYDAKCKNFILKSGRKQGAHYYAFNTDNKAARENIEAAFHFMAEYASKQDYHVDNWILGNEVNTYANMNAKWYYAGNISKDKFIKHYASAFRMLYYAVKSNNKNGRVYICCDHTWSNRENDWGVKNFTKAFHKEIKKQNKNIKWNLAYHAYSAVLTNADFWNDGGLAPNNNDAAFVSPKNLEILTKYVKKNFGKNVRIILSEQGFSYSGGTGSPYNAGRQTGESVQAAAVAYLYYKAQFSDMIDAVIFSSGDHGGPGYQFDFMGKKSEKVYKYMDTPKSTTYTNPYLSTIGASSWKGIVKGFDENKLKSMPNR